MIPLNTPVDVSVVEAGRIVWHPAVLVGRTLEEQSRFDVRLPNGAILANVSGDRIRIPEAA